MEFYELNNGVKIPKIGFGTYQMAEGDETYNAVTEALKSGYRHIDTAQFYANENSVGQAIKDSGIPRDEIFVTTKLWNSVLTYDDALTTFAECLNKLDLPYVDLLLIHWPNPIEVRDNDQWKERNKEVWRAFETLYSEGKVKSIGVSNFREHHLKALFETAEIKPMVNQIKLAPGLTEATLVDFCREQSMVIEAYTPLGRGTVLTDDTISQIAEKYDKNNVQVALRWSLDKGFLPLPKSSTLKNIASNLDIFDFELDEDDIEAMDNIKGIAEASDPDARDF